MPSANEQDKPNVIIGRDFEGKVVDLLRLFGFGIERDVQIGGMQIDTMARTEIAGLSINVVVEGI